MVNFKNIDLNTNTEKKIIYKTNFIFFKTILILKVSEKNYKKLNNSNC